jgi:hypothetical protein
MTETRKLRVFLCHSSQDKPIVRELYQRLNAEGWIDPWLDEEKLLPGQDWGLEIEKAVEVVDAVIVCLSNNSVTKEGYIQRELKFVLDIAQEKPEGVIFLIPVRLDECIIPRRLKSWQYTDYYPAGNREIALKRILRSLKLRAKAFPLQSGSFENTDYEVDLVIPSSELTYTGLSDILSKSSAFMFGVLSIVLLVGGVILMMVAMGLSNMDNSSFSKSFFNFSVLLPPFSLLTSLVGIIIGYTELKSSAKKWIKTGMVMCVFSILLFCMITWWFASSFKF